MNYRVNVTDQKQEIYKRRPEILIEANFGSLCPENLPIGVYAVTIKALEPVELSHFSASTLRGAFGWSFKRMVCYQPQVKSCRGCLLRSQCAYPPIFEPPPPPDSLYAKQPQVTAPYVLRPPGGQARRFEPGERFTFEVVLVGRAIGALPYFAVALQQLEQQGIGRGRGRGRVVRIAALPPPHVAGAETPAPLFDEAQPDVIQTHGGWPASAYVGDGPAPTQVTVHFQSMVRLMSDGRLQEAPDFHVFYRALLRRVSALCTVHGAAPWETDFAEMAQAARAVETVSSQMQEARRSRRSDRQERVVEMWGSQGLMGYQGDLTRFWPLLQLGQVLHVGKNCTFGLGRYGLLVGV